VPVRELLFHQVMETARQPRSPVVRPAFKRARNRGATWSSTRHAMSTYIADEIRAYATIRDLAVAEAERVTNKLNLARARIANDFVENALKPTRPSHDGQHLPAGEAARERQRCEAAKVRLSLLHAHLAAMSREHVQAA
jgi:hypothetical protein